ncbi:MAG: AAA domain-containing protein, partial [Gemmatimonadota bacterium]
MRHDETLGLLLADCQRALEEEIEAVRDDLDRRGLGSPVPATGGRSAGEAGLSFAYDFRLPRRRFDIRADDRVRIRIGPREALAVVREYDRALSSIRVFASDWLGERIADAELEFDPTWLLRELALRLDAIAETPGAFHPETILGLTGRRYPALGRADSEVPPEGLNDPQRDALARILGSDVQLVWGPPGTGKTRLVARAALALAREGRVLVVAATNGAIDEAVGRIATQLDAQAVGANRVVRLGSELGGAAHPEVSLETALRRRIAGGAGGIARELAGIERGFGIR